MVLVNALVSRVCDGWNVERRGQPDQICERIGVQLPHHLTSVCFHSDLADAEFGCHLFVQQTGNDQSHDLSLADTECQVTFAKSLSFCFLMTRRLTALDGLPDGIQQHVVAEWFGQELHCSGLHRPDGGWHVPMTCDEDDRHVC